MNKILVVDDETDLQLLIRQKFRKQIFSKEMDFVFATNGKLALDTLDKEQDIRLVISDINMPEMDGLKLLEHIGQRMHKPITIMVSAYGDMDNIRAAMNLGAFDFVTKPVNFGDLQITVQKAMEQNAFVKDATQNKKQLHSLMSDLKVAADIQRSILPKDFIRTPEVSLWANMIPAQAVGGDFYDFFWIKPGLLGLVIADVSGKGIPAALFMTVSRTLLRSQVPDAVDPGTVFTRVNNMLCQDNENSMFVTAWFGQLDVHTGQLIYSNAGHNPTLWVSQTGDGKWDTRHGVPLGVQEGLEYGNSTVQLERATRFMLYTDGIPDAVDPQDNLFGEERLQDALKEARDTKLEPMARHVEEVVGDFRQDAPQSDDITYLCVHWAGDGMEA